MSEELYRILATIDVLKDQLNKLKFLAQAVVPFGPQLENCNSIPELFKLLRESQSLQRLDYRYGVSLLRHMLVSIGCNQGKKLQPHCHEEFDLVKIAPKLVFFYEPLLHSADRLLRNGSNYKCLLNSTDENMLSKPKSDISSPLDLFQSMICRGTLDPRNLPSLKSLMTKILGAAGLEGEAELFRQSLQPDQHEACTNQGASSWSSKAPTADELHPLLNSRSSYDDSTCLTKTKRSEFSGISPKYKIWCFVSSCIILVALLTIVVVSFIFAKPTSSTLSQTQSIYGPEPITYSPFSHINSLYYKTIKSTIYVDQNEDLGNYNLTICKELCPLKVVTLHSQVSGVCPKDRFYHNCYINLLGYQDAGVNSQYYSQYMLTNSKVTFTITSLSPAEQPVQLCITIDKDTCSQIFFRMSTGATGCQEVLQFNKTNSYTRTFAARKDSYYCAVWILAGNQSINYTLNSSLELYDIQTPHSRCENYRKSKVVTFDLGDRWHSVATQQHKVCILVQENGKNLYRNITVVTKAVRSLDNIFFISGIVSLVLSFTIITVLVVIIIVSFRC